jgi:tetraacyldisaccharide 4'-kinase
MIPAGPVRAPLRVQLKRAQALIVVGRPDAAGAVIDRARRGGISIFHGRLEPDRGVLTAIGRRKVLAFAGIADPEKFFTTLTAAGIEIGEHAAFADHHRFTARQAQDLLARAQARNLMLVTTEKDYVRLSGQPGLERLAVRSSALPVRLVIEEEDQLRQMLLSVVLKESPSLVPERLVSE